MLEMRLPRFSTADAVFIRKNMTGRTLFPHIKDAEERAHIKDQLLSIEYRLPTLRSFFEDAKHLYHCAPVLKMLLPRKKKRTREEAKRSLEISTGIFSGHPLARKSKRSKASATT